MRLTRSAALMAAALCCTGAAWAAAPDLDELVKLVHEKTVFGSLAEAKLKEGAARGLVDVLDETLGKPPFSGRASPESTAQTILERARDEHEINCFYTPRDFQLLQQELGGSFGGIGARISMKQYRAEWRTAAGRTSTLSTAVELLEAMPGSPAERAGLKKGDHILAIDGEPVDQHSLSEIVAKLRGAVGSTVRLTVDRPPGAPLVLPVVRDVVRVSSVSFEKLDGGLGRLEIGSFNPNTMAELGKALDAARGVKGLVLDLRGCPGGRLDVAIEAAAVFMPKGSAVVTLGRPGGSEETLVTTAPPRYEGPMVVLVDHQTASSGEILAAAIQSHHRGLVAGEITFGKRTAETIFSLAGGYAAKLSTSFFRRPGPAAAGAPGFPVIPDVALRPVHPGGDEGPPSNQDRKAPDPQLAAATALLGWHTGDAVK